MFSQTLNNLTKFSFIYKHYFGFMQILTKLLEIPSKFHSFNPKSTIDEVYIPIARNYIDVDILTKTIINSINQTERSLPYEITTERSEHFESIRDASFLLSHIYMDIHEEKIITDLINDELSFSELFLRKSDTSLYMRTALNVMEREKEMFTLLFGKTVCNNVIKTCYATITESFLFESSLTKMEELLHNRDDTGLKMLYSILTFINPSQSMMSLFNKAISSSLDHEKPTDSINMAEILRFYGSSLKECCCNSSVLESYNKAATDFVNKDPLTLIKDVIKHVTNAAKKTSDVSFFSEVLQRMSNKSEFELLHTRTATKRLLPPDPRQIDRDQLLMQNLRALSPLFEFRTLGKILSEARQSLEYHIPNVVFIHSSLWPYKQQPYGPLRIKSLTKDVIAKYNEMYPSRCVNFPIQSFIISIRDTVKNVTIVCNGLQAEGLLFFNDSKTATVNSLAPNFPPNVMSVVFESMSSKKFPVLTKIENPNGDGAKDKYIYSVNEQKISASIIKLPNFSIVHSDPRAKVARFEAVDACLARVLKKNNRMNITDLLNESCSELMEQFRVSYDEMRSRIDTLVERGYIGIEGNEAIYLP